MSIKVKTHKFVDIDPVEAILSIRDDIFKGLIVEDGIVYERSNGPLKQMKVCDWIPDERTNQLVSIHNGIQSLLGWYQND